MIQLLLILCFLSLHLEEFTSSARPVSMGFALAAAIVIGPLLFITLLTNVVCRAQGRIMDTRGSVKAYFRAESLINRSRIIGTLWFAAAGGTVGWGMHVREWTGPTILLDTIIALTPAFGFFIALWWNLYPLDRRIREANLYRELTSGGPITPIPLRREYLLGHIRHSMLLVALPILLVTAWNDSIAMVTTLQPRLTIAGVAWTRMEEPIRWLGIALMLVIAPALLRLSWDTIPLNEGPTTAMTRFMCRHYGVKVKGPFVWRTHTAMVNGAILGVLFPLRYLLLTDGLLSRLSDEQVEGVLAHEVAHIKKRHMAWLGVSIIASILAFGWALSAITYLLHIDSQSDTAALVASIGSLVVAALVFGFVSRRFEWQADAFSVRHLSCIGPGRDGATITAPAADTISRTLGAVADLNGMDRSAFSWRHGSIEQRCRNVEGLVGLDAGNLPIDRRVRWIKIISAVVLIVGGIPLFLS